MKKVLLALTLCLVLCVTLLGCGKKMTGADYLFDAMDNLTASMQNKNLEKVMKNADGGMKVSVGAADLSSLVSVIGGGAAGLPTLTDAEFSVKMQDAKTALGLSVTLNGKAYALDLVTDGKDIALVTEMLNKNYGISAEELKSLVGTQTVKEALGAFEAASVSTDAEAVKTYIDALKKTAREKIAFTLTENGDTVTVTFTLTPENAADMLTAIAAEANGDVAARILAQQLGIEDAEGADLRTALLNELTDAGFEADFTAEIIKKSKKLVSLDGDIKSADGTAALTVAAVENGFCYGLADADGKTETTVILKDGLYSVETTGTKDGITAAVKLEFADGKGTLAVEAPGTMSYSVDMTYALTDKAVDLQLVSAQANGKDFDLTSTGVTVHVGTDADMPEMPAEYTSVAAFGETEWQAVVTELLTKNPELLTLLMGMMQ